jgi:hypothetical protein
MSRRKAATSALALVLGLFGFLPPHPGNAGTRIATSWLDGAGEVLTLSPVSMEAMELREITMPETRTADYINVLQDCWTTDEASYVIDVELENYLFTAADSIVFVWKHKIFKPCSNYLVTIVGVPCQPGKPPIAGRIAWVVPDVPFGALAPGFEYILSVTVPGMPLGNWDWFVISECDDTNGRIVPPLVDNDIDDVIGANLGVVPYAPLVYGPEPFEVLNPTPGGVPPGRVPGEEGACRCWCFTVQ